MLKPLTLCLCVSIAGQALLSSEFFRQKYWSGLPFPSPGNLPNLRIKPRSPALQEGSLHGRHWGGSGGGGVRTYVWKRETGTGRSHLPPRQGGMWGSRAGSGLGGTEAKCQTAEGASSGPEGASPGTCPGLLPAPLCSAEPVLVWGCLCPHPAPRPQGLHQGRRPAARDPASL